MSDIDTDIDSYSFNELKSLLNLSETEKFTREQLDRNYNIKINQLQDIDDIQLKTNLYKFFTNIRDYLSIYINTVWPSNSNSNSNSNIEYLENKLDKLQYTIDYKLNNIIEEAESSKKNIYSFNQVNESNLAVNQKTYNTIKKQISINSEFRRSSQRPKKSSTSNKKFNEKEFNSSIFI